MTDGNQQLSALPSDLPVPLDDGACDHLKNTNTPFPSTALPSTAKTKVDPSTLSGLSILFLYPRTGNTQQPVPDEWNAIPGARGCTPQACSFRDAADDLRAAGTRHIFGVSTQDTEYQLEAKERLHLPYELLSDEKLELARGLGLPTFDFDGMTLIKRLTLAVEDGRVVKVWYPVFPPDRSAGEVLEWLRGRKG